MKRSAYIALMTLLLPAGLSAQADPVERLSEVLPADMAAQVMAQVENARARALPEDAVANLALEGMAKGRSADEVLAAVQTLVGDLGMARDAIEGAGRTPQVGEVEAATAAMRMGVDGSTISELAGSQPSGRSLTVPMLVIGGLADRGLPADEALARVAQRLAAQADDAALVSEMAGVGMGAVRGAMPAHAGPPVAGGGAGFQVPVQGINVPVGPPDNVGGRPGNRPGRPDGLPSQPGGPGGNPGG